MRSSRWLFAVLLCTPCAVIACGDDDEEGTTPVDGGADPGALDAGMEGDAGADAAGGESFSAIYQEIFSVRGCPGCHTGEDHLSMLDLSSRDEAYEGLVGEDAAGSECNDSNAQRVGPGNADGSLLIWKLEGEDDQGEGVCGARMPLDSPPLSQAEIDRVRAWIDEGAQDN